MSSCKRSSSGSVDDDKDSSGDEEDHADYADFKRWLDRQNPVKCDKCGWKPCKCF